MSKNQPLPGSKQKGTEKEETMGEPVQQKMLGALDTLLETAGRIENSLNEKYQAQSVMKAMYDQLYAEMEQYKEDHIARHFHRPLVRDLIALYDNVHKREKETASSETAAELGHIRTDLLSLLARIDVDDYESALPEMPGKASVQLHKIVATVPGHTPEEDMDIAEEIRTGFFWKGAPVRLAHVVVKKYEGPGQP